MPYRVLEHTADFKMAVFGKDLTELFQSAFSGMTAYLKKPENKKNTVSRKIKVEAPDNAILLVDFLNKILALAQINKEIYQSVKFSRLADTELEAEVFGYPVDSFTRDIKAATYHGAEIKKEGDVFKTNLIFDV